MKRRLLISASIVATLAALGAGIAYATGTLPSFVGTDGTISACVQTASGQTRLVQPGGQCRRDEAAVRWNQHGPAGPAGAQGAAGKDGRSLTASPIAKGASACGGNGGLAVSYDDGTAAGDICNGADGAQGSAGSGGSSLVGSPCTRADGSGGTIDLAVDSDNTISFSCAALPSSPPPPTPTTPPVLAPIDVWNDQEGPYQLDSVLDRGATEESPSIAADCSGAFAFGCADGTPASPVPTLTTDLLYSPSTTVTHTPGASLYRATMYFRVASDNDIRMTLQGESCGLAIDTTRAGSQSLELQFSINVLDSAPDGPTQVTDVAVSGIDPGDVSISGGPLCQAIPLPTDFVQAVASLLQSPLTPIAEWRGTVCGDKPGLYFQDCVTGAPWPPTA